MNYMWNGAKTFPRMRLETLAVLPDRIINYYNQLVIYYIDYTKFSVLFGLIVPINPFIGFF